MDQSAVQWRADTALRRMRNHEQRTGVPFEPVMVFPQGRFSTPAVLALRRGGYLAAVNSTCFPTDEGAETLRMADFLRPAVTRFYGFPIFQRRYPRRLIDCAFDMFLGRPALLVEHHEYFRDGCERLEEFVRNLQEIDEGLTWTTLASQLMRSCTMREAAEGKTEVQFFTRRFQLENSRENRATFLLRKHEPSQETVAAVRAGGADVPFSFEDGFLFLELQVDPGRLVDVEIIDRPRLLTTAADGPGVRYTMGVAARRALSEIRDNTLARNPRLLKAATEVARRMRVTGDQDREKSSSVDPSEQTE